MLHFSEVFYMTLLEVCRDMLCLAYPLFYYCVVLPHIDESPANETPSKSQFFVGRLCIVAF